MELIQGFVSGRADCIPTDLLPLGEQRTLLGAVPLDCCVCTPGCWSQVGFGWWERRIWAGHSLLRATSLLPLLTCPRDPLHSVPQASMAKLGQLQTFGVLHPRLAFAH